MYPEDYRYTKEHEWVSLSGDTATIGITAHAQDQLGDVVFVEMPEVGAKLHSGQTFGTVESVKAVSDIYSPISGEVAEINDTLIDAPERLNEDPHGEGWLVKATVTDKSALDGLMSAEAYQQYAAAETES